MIFKSISCLTFACLLVHKGKFLYIFNHRYSLLCSQNDDSIFLYSYFLLFFLFEVVSQNAPIPTQPPEPEPQEGLKCWECSPIELSVSPNSHMNQLECLTNDDKYGELKTCDAFNGACAKGTIG